MLLCPGLVGRSVRSSAALLSFASLGLAVTPCHAALPKRHHTRVVAFVIPDPDWRPAIVFQPVGTPAPAGRMPAAVSVASRPAPLPASPGRAPAPSLLIAAVSKARIGDVLKQAGSRAPVATPVIATAMARPPEVAPAKPDHASSPAVQESAAAGPPLCVTISFSDRRAGAREKADALASTLRAQGVPVEDIQTDRHEAAVTRILFGFEEDRPVADQVGRTLEAATGISSPSTLSPDAMPARRPGLIQIALPG